MVSMLFQTPQKQQKMLHMLVVIFHRKWSSKHNYFKPDILIEIIIFYYFTVNINDAFHCDRYHVSLKSILLLNRKFILFELNCGLVL